MACFALSLPLGTVQRVQLGYQEGFESNLWQCAASTLGFACVLIAIFLHAGLPWLVLAMAGAPVIVTGANWVLQFCHTRPWLFPRFQDVEWSGSRQLIGAGSMFLVLQVFALMGNMSDSLVLAQLLGPAAVAEYTVAQKLFSLALLVQFFLVPLWPAFGDALERKDYDWARRTLRRGLVMSLSLTALATIPILIFGKFLVAIWVGQELVPSSALLAALGCWVILASYGGVMSVLLNNGPLLRKQTLFYGIASISALMLKIVITPIVGISGVVWATVLGYGVFYVVPAAWVAHNALHDRLANPPQIAVQT
jgi:O-antigen/teichoic acid export membrane protein